MDAKRLIAALAPSVSQQLATDLVGEFLKIRQDYATKTLERAGLGKFVETFVQCLQFMATSSFDAKPSVDDYLDKKADKTSLPEGLRVVAARIARSIYTLRNKRNILHKNPVDPSVVDLAFAHEGAAWILAELLRNAASVSMDEAARLIAMVEAPVSHVVEVIDGVPIIHGKVTVAEEVLILLHSEYPDRVSRAAIDKSLHLRSFKSVDNRLRELVAGKIVQGDNHVGYCLTLPGHKKASSVLQRLSTS